MVTSAARACGFGNPQGETTVVVSFYHRNWRFEETGTGSPQGFIASRGAFSPFANATQWLDDSLASMLPGGPFWGYGAPTDGHFAFSFKNPNLTDTWGEWELNGIAGCLIKCKWAETVDAPQPPGKDFVFKEWKFNFRDFEENYGWNAFVWYRDNYVPDCAPQPPPYATPVRYTALTIPAGTPGEGYYLGPGSYWTYEMNCTPKHYTYNDRPVVLVQPNAPAAGWNGIFVPMPAATCDERYGSLWMGRVDQTTSAANACANYVANRNNGIANPATCDPQIELNLVPHETGYELFVAPQGFIHSGGGIISDFNHDRKIDSVDRMELSYRGPMRFWINDDADVGDLVDGDSDLPGSATNPNWADGHVNGRSDLIDFFPVWLDIKEILNLYQPGQVVVTLDQEDEAVNIIYTDLDKEHAGDYLTVDDQSYGVNRDQYAYEAAILTAKTRWSPPSQVDFCTLDAGFVNRIRDGEGKGILLVEARKGTQKPLTMQIQDASTRIPLHEFKLNLRFSGVEQMFRHLNLRDGPDAPTNLPGPSKSGDVGNQSHMEQPPNLPDLLSNNRWLIFVHGYNVSALASRAWEAEMFKRLYWSGSQAKYVGVDWRGNPNGDHTIANWMTADYHLAVMNAFASAQKLAQILNPLLGSKTIVGHSLGCGVTAFAMKDFSLDVAHACLVDAALASESFDGDSAEDLLNMAYEPWTRSDNPDLPSYPRELWAADWHKLFLAGNDARQTLTWKTNFTSVLPKTHNFYSSTEEVLKPFIGVPTQSIIENLMNGQGIRTYAWCVQEKAKGNALRIPLLGPLTGTDYGGWGFNLYDPIAHDPADPSWWEVRNADPPYYPGYRTRLYADHLPSYTPDGLTRSPLFDTGWGRCDPAHPTTPLVDETAIHAGCPSWIVNLYKNATGSAIAADPVKRAQLLSQAIPAISTPVGQRALISLLQSQRNYPMPDAFAPDGSPWPAARGREQGTQTAIWYHSDIRDVAYLYVYGFFDSITTIANSNP